MPQATVDSGRITKERSGAVKEDSMYCPHCGKETTENAPYCIDCGGAQPGTPAVASPPPREDFPAGMEWVLPIGRSPFAIIAGYVGLVSIFLVFPAPIALVLGIVSVLHIRRTEFTGMGRAVFAIITGGLGTLVLIWIIFQILQGEG